MLACRCMFFILLCLFHVPMKFIFADLGCVFLLLGEVWFIIVLLLVLGFGFDGGIIVFDYMAVLLFIILDSGQLGAP